MALSEENGGGTGMVMPVAPMTGGFSSGMPYPVPMYGMGGGQSGGNNGWGDGGWWIVLLIIVIAALGGNWGGNNGGNGGGMFGGGTPIVINDGGSNYNSVQRGFDQAAIMSGIGNIQNGVQGLSTQLCNCCSDMNNTVNSGFFGVQNALCNGFNGVEQNANTRQIANMQQAFAAQTAMSQGFNQLSSNLSDCCCENRLATNDLRYTIATENCADRQAISDGIRDLLTAQTAGFQSIKDLLFEDRIDEKNDRIASLERQLTAANLNASQIAQTAQIVDQTYNRLSTCPVGTVPVYGETPIFQCNNNGCGCNGGF